MKTKIILFLLVFVLLIGIVFPAEETISKTIDIGKSEEIGSLFGLENTDITGSGVELNGNIFTFLKGGFIIIKGIKFENITESSSIELDKRGKMISADLTASEDTLFNFMGQGSCRLSKGQRAIYKDGKFTFEKGGGKNNLLLWTPELLSKKGIPLGRLSIIKMNGESVNIERDGKGNSIITGDFDMGNNNIKGIGNNVGKVTVSSSYNSGEILEIWTGTNAKMRGIDFKVTGDNLNMYYDENFNPADYKGQNYFNYGKGKISAGGIGFSSDLGKINNIFGDMKTEKYIMGQKEPKTRDFEIKMDGGNLEISKDTKNIDDLAFNILSNGKVVIDNGKNVLHFENGGVFVNVLKDEEGLLYSYDLNINKGEYTLENNFFKNKEGNVLINVNTPWENTILKGKEITYTDSNGEKVLTNEAQYISDTIQKERGTRPMKYNLFADDEIDEEMVKWTYKNSEWVNNNNKYGITVYPEEVFSVVMLEAGASSPFQTSYINYRDEPVESPRVGLDYIGNSATLNSRKNGGFIPSNLNLESTWEWTNELKEKTTAGTFRNMEDAVTAVAGEYAYRKYRALEIYKNYYGKNMLNQLTSSQKTQLAYYAYNCGIGCLQKAIGDVNEKVFKPWEGSSGEGKINNAKLNSQRLIASVEFLQDTGLFSFP